MMIGMTSAHFTHDNWLVIELPETIDFQRQLVKLLQDNDFMVFCDNSTREKLTAEKTDNVMALSPAADRVPYGYIHDAE